MTISVNNWVDTVKVLISNIHIAKKGHSGYYFQDITLDNFDLKEDPFSTCLYRNRQGKLTTLRKQYLNQESLSKIFSDQVVEISMIGGPKWGSTSGNKHCMRSLVVDHNQKTVRINFRNSDFLKKFLVDIYFVKLILSEVGVKDYTYSCYFENLTIRLPFVYLFLNSVYLKEGENSLRSYLSSGNTIISEFLLYYKKQLGKTLTYKSLERAQRIMKELKSFEIIKEYL
jgi:hypothetical protein